MKQQKQQPSSDSVDAKEGESRFIGTGDEFTVIGEMTPAQQAYSDGMRAGLEGSIRDARHSAFPVEWLKGWDIGAPLGPLGREDESAGEAAGDAGEDTEDQDQESKG